MPIKQHSVVSFAYKLTDDEGTLIDQGDKDAPLVYMHGHQNLIVGVEEALEGKDVGDQLDIVVPPEKGYGSREPELDLILGFDQFPQEHHSELAPGVQFQGPHPAKEGIPVVYTIHQIDGDQIFVSGNHDLVDKTLHFSVEITSVRDASEEEIEHGHPLGEH